MSFEHSKLANGINLVTFNMPYVNSVSINVIVKVGSRFESEDESGISHFLEHMAFKGTASRSAEKIAEEFDAIGGHFNAYTSREHTVYYTKVLKENFSTAVEILADILQNSLFTEEDIKKEYGVILQEIAAVNDSPDDLVYEKFYELAFANQPIGRSILGTPENLWKYGKSDFQNFMAKHYTTDKIFISVAGNIEHALAKNNVEKLFTNFSSGNGADIIGAKYAGGFANIDKPLEQTSIALGFKSRPYAILDQFYHVQILSVIFGGGFSSRLFQRIRENLGLAYSVGSFNSSYSDNGIFSIYAGTDHENVAKLLTNLATEIRKLQENITDEELTRAKSQIKASILMAEERSERKSEDIGKSYSLFNKYHTTSEIINMIMTITVQDLTNCAEEIFSSGATLAIIGKTPSNFSFEKFQSRLK